MVANNPNSLTVASPISRLSNIPTDKAPKFIRSKIGVILLLELLSMMRREVFWPITSDIQQEKAVSDQMNYRENT